MAGEKETAWKSGDRISPVSRPGYHILFREQAIQRNLWHW